ncbi:MAG: DUF2064 domain-containing protein [Planctomycetes bacterium]|nr:DUF2064 domain-containing protein [Planctomycetota bacterium]
MADSALIIIARAPERGRVKTRLAADIGLDAALAVYHQLLGRVAMVAHRWPGRVAVCSTGDDRLWRDSALEPFERLPQPATGLGGRVGAALRLGLERARRTVIIGTDCPSLDMEAAAALVALLDEAPVALGPAEDGGYWGVAVVEPAPIPLIADETLPWSTPRLCERTRQALADGGFTSVLGARLRDCDDANDLRAAVQDGWLPPLPAMAAEPASPRCPQAADAVARASRPGAEARPR